MLEGRTTLSAYTLHCIACTFILHQSTTNYKDLNHALELTVVSASMAIVRAALLPGAEQAPVLSPIAGSRLLRSA